VFADDTHVGARALLANTFDRLAYGAENATWRNFFLSGAVELRDGNFGTATQATSMTMMAQLTPEQIFDGLAISVNGPRASDLDLAIDVTLTDVSANYRLALRNGVLVHRKVAADSGSANVTVKLDNTLRLLTVAIGDVASPGLEISGDQTALQQLLGVLDKPDPAFNIVTP
jgi:alkyl sulfatase BDS1-like metallo-beta-lactamase superfamily hydrolase